MPAPPDRLQEAADLREGREPAFFLASGPAFAPEPTPQEVGGMLPGEGRYDGGTFDGGELRMTGVIVAAAARAAALNQEEEDMAGYASGDMDGWEFKIVRSNSPRFRRYQDIQKLCREEAEAGWELLEKFDDNRIRFKRRVAKRDDDRYLNIDPYRTSVGIGQRQMTLIAVAAAAVLTLAVMISLILSR